MISVIYQGPESLDFPSLRPRLETPDRCKTRILIIFIQGAQKLIAKEQIVEQICILLQDVDRHNDQANHTIKEYDLDGVIEGCIGALHACRNVSLLVRRALTDADI